MDNNSARGNDEFARGTENVDRDPAENAGALLSEWMTDLKSGNRSVAPETGRTGETGRTETNGTIPELSLENSRGNGNGSTEEFKGDVRETLMHFAGYKHCRFEDRNEYAGSLDKAFKAFVDNPNVSENMKPLQTMLGEFLNNPSKEGLQKFCDSFLKWWQASGNSARDTLRELDAETAKGMTPERRQADATATSNMMDFYSSLDKLPKEEKDRVMKLLDWQDEVSREQRNQRVRDGLKDNPKLLEKFNQMQNAMDSRDALKSERERTLQEQSRQQIRDNRLAHAISDLVRRRSRL